MEKFVSVYLLKRLHLWWLSSSINYSREQPLQNIYTPHEERQRTNWIEPEPLQNGRMEPSPLSRRLHEAPGEISGLPYVAYKCLFPTHLTRNMNLDFRQMSIDAFWWWLCWKREMKSMLLIPAWKVGSSEISIKWIEKYFSIGAVGERSRSWGSFRPGAKL